MALDTLCAGRGRTVSVMLFLVVNRRLVALRAQTIAFGEQGIAMRVMAVGADHVRLMHLALYE